MKCLYAEIPTSTCVYVWPISMYFFDCCTAFHPSSKWTKCHGWPTVVLITLPDYPWLAVSYHVHIPVDNEHLFRFKMNADSGLRVHRFRTPQCTYSDVRWTVLFQRLGSTTAALRLAAGLFSESKRCLPSKLSFCSKNPCPHTFRKWCSQIPESLFNFTGIRIGSHHLSCLPACSDTQCEIEILNSRFSLRLHPLL